MSNQESWPVWGGAIHQYMTTAYLCEQDNSCIRKFDIIQTVLTACNRLYNTQWMSLANLPLKQIITDEYVHFYQDDRYARKLNHFDNFRTMSPDDQMYVITDYLRTYYNLHVYCHPGEVYFQPVCRIQLISQEFLCLCLYEQYDYSDKITSFVLDNIVINQYSNSYTNYSDRLNYFQLRVGLGVVLKARWNHI